MRRIFVGALLLLLMIGRGDGRGQTQERLLATRAVSTVQACSVTLWAEVRPL